MSFQITSSAPVAVALLRDYPRWCLIGERAEISNVDPHDLRGLLTRAKAIFMVDAGLIPVPAELLEAFTRATRLGPVLLACPDAKTRTRMKAALAGLGAAQGGRA